MGGIVMRYVESVEELKQNMETLDRYLTQKCESTYSFALGLIKKGSVLWRFLHSQAIASIRAGLLGTQKIQKISMKITI